MDDKGLFPFQILVCVTNPNCFIIIRMLDLIRKTFRLKIPYFISLILRQRYVSGDSVMPLYKIDLNYFRNICPVSPIEFDRDIEAFGNLVIRIRILVLPCFNRCYYKKAEEQDENRQN